MGRDAFDPARVRVSSEGDHADRIPRETETLARRVIGAAINVHRELGPGYGESVYHRALSLELAAQSIPFVAEAPMTVLYRGQCVGEGRIDLLVDERLVLELKAVEEINKLHVAQVLAYLKAKRLPLGLLINFNVPVLKEGVKRVIF